MSNAIPLMDAIDMEILMHRDAHFGASFGEMIDYYEKESVGVMPDFELKRIRELAHIEKETDGDLSSLVLSKSAHSQIEAAKQLYMDLREVYEKDPANPHAILLSNLILSEKPHPTEEIAAIVHEGSEMVPLLIDLISSESFYDPLFPGYGRAPLFAAECLAELKDETAIPVLFGALGQENFFTDEAMIKALSSFGKKSKTFLINALKHKPYSRNNEHAAICLLEFGDDPEIASCCLDVLKEVKSLKNNSFAAYLVFGCAGLEKDQERKDFKDLLAKLEPKSDLAREMQIVCSNWNK